MPYVTYNNTRYSVHNVSGDLFETEDMVLDANVKMITLTIGDTDKIMKINITTGVVEDDLFNM